MDKLRIPLFPLHSVLFPGGALPLRVFESRYLDMISQCMRHKSNFGICLISDGSEVGDAAATFNVGTLVEISYFQQLKDGCLGITARGKQRFRILSSEVESNQLTTAEIQLLPLTDELTLPDEFEDFRNILSDIFNELGHPYTSLPKHYNSATWVSARLAELLPIGLQEKQTMLEMEDPIQRLIRIREILTEK
ncbi:MAG: LON peptidase substrate-binding domain-containing protein [Gammaproteobacteria bacterium]|nr:LON peptidase substrate-binding domain-containing protein [Gammaproteobacteria bacterium]